MNDQLRGFQKRFIKGALAPGIDVAALSIPRGNGKSWLAADLLRRCLTPGDELHVLVLSSFCALVPLSKQGWFSDSSGRL